MFACEYCNYGSIHKHNVTRHEKRRHANETKRNINKQLNQHQYPTADSNANIIQNQHNSHYGTGQNKHTENEKNYEN